MCEKIWDKFHMKNMGDYHDLLLLFEKRCIVISKCFLKVHWLKLKFYGLDLFHCFSPPGLSWDAMLKMTSVKLE